MACSIKIESHDKKDISSIDSSCKGKITLLITTHSRCLTTCDSFYKDKYISVIRKNILKNQTCKIYYFILTSEFYATD